MAPSFHSVSPANILVIGQLLLSALMNTLGPIGSSQVFLHYIQPMTLSFAKVSVSEVQDGRCKMRKRVVKDELPFNLKTAY